MNCEMCKAGEEQLCKKGMIGTYNGRDKYGRAGVVPIGSATLGGYSNKFVVHEYFAIVIPPSYPLEFAGPIMCAGITMYTPLKNFAKQGSRVAVVGLGGLGQMGVRLAKAMGKFFCSFVPVN